MSEEATPQAEQAELSEKADAKKKRADLTRIESLAPRIHESFPLMLTLIATIFYCINMLAIMTLSLIMTH